MKKTTLLFLLFTALQAKAQLHKSTEGTVSFFSQAPLEDIDATSSGIKSTINTSTNEIVFGVPIISFQFKNKKMEQDFNENFMETEKYPIASYKGKIREKIDWSKNGSYIVTSKGILTIHGVSKERTDTATIIIKDAKTTINSNFRVKVADHKIDIPKILFEKIAEVVLVKLEVSYPTEKNKKEISKNE